MPESRIGDFNVDDVYSVDAYGDYIYFGLTDFSYPDKVVVIDLDGNIVNEYSVGVAPGDFAYWEPCIANGDINGDNQINISDIILTMNIILGR